MSKKDETRKLKITTLDKPVVGEPVPDIHWGESAHNIEIDGEVVEIEFIRNGEYEFCIRILDNGDLIITKYTGGGYSQMLDNNTRLVNGNPWK